MISCQRAAMLGSKSAYDSLTLIERISLKWHLKMCTCPTCHQFSHDSELIDEAIGKVMKTREHKKISLNEDQTRKIKEALNNQSQND